VLSQPHEARSLVFVYTEAVHPATDTAHPLRCIGHVHRYHRHQISTTVCLGRSTTNLASLASLACVISVNAPTETAAAQCRGLVLAVDRSLVGSSKARIKAAPEVVDNRFIQLSYLPFNDSTAAIYSDYVLMQ
jgi:hypothetical protein